MNRRGFTLLELLVASALAMLVMGLAMGGYRHSQRLISQAETLLRLHRVAGDLAERWEKDCTALLQHVACNAETTYDGALKDRVAFTGMRSMTATFEGRIYDYPHDTDIAWVRWQWDAASRRIVRSESPPPHWITATQREFFAQFESTGIPIRPVMSMRPNPVRTFGEFETGQKLWHDPFDADPSTKRSVRIYDLLFLTGKDFDGSVNCPAIGEEMTSNAANRIPNNQLNSGTRLSAAAWSALPVNDPGITLAEDVSDCAIVIVTRSGLTVADGGAGLDRNFDGAFQDGTGPSGDRPDLMRLTFTLTDRRSGLSQEFSFTAKAPR